MTNQGGPIGEAIVEFGISEHVVDQVATSSGLASNCWLFLLSHSRDAVVIDASLNEFGTFPLAQLIL